jgi:hypothetical protein
MSLVAGAHVALLLGVAGGLGVVPMPKFTEMTASVIDEREPLPPPTIAPKDFKIEPNQAVRLLPPDLPPLPADGAPPVVALPPVAVPALALVPALVLALPLAPELPADAPATAGDSLQPLEASVSSSAANEQ